MSLPKEPRQIMITLMYLVLLAMLAMNVSAEIMNAFLSLEKGIGNSNKIVELSNTQISKAIDTQANAYKEYEKFNQKAKYARLIADTLHQQVKRLKTELFARAGGTDPKNVDRPLRYKDKDIASQLLIEEGEGNRLKQQIIHTRNQLLELIEDDDKRATLTQSIPLQIPEKPASSDKKTWSESAFYQMPVIAVMPMLTKISNDIKTSETAILNHFLEKAKGEKTVLDQFEVVSAADQGYIIRGEDYKSEIFLGAYSDDNNISVTIDGRRYPVKDGKASYQINANQTGKKQYKAVISVRNPVTKEIKRYSKTFAYEVGERSVTVAADKMNVLYIGVPNPISVSAAGTNSNSLRVSATGTPLEKINNNKYIAKPKKTGIAKINVSGEGLPPTNFEYRVKRIPDPILHLGNKTGGKISPGEFKVHQGPIPFLKDFEFDAKCKIVGFELVRLNKNKEVSVHKNRGGRYQGRAKNMVSQAKSGDQYFFNEVKVKCPGDTHGRSLNGMIFNIE